MNEVTKFLEQQVEARRKAKKQLLQQPKCSVITIQNDTRPWKAWGEDISANVVSILGDGTIRRYTSHQSAEIGNKLSRQ
jgi:hypothetical protein